MSAILDLLNRYRQSAQSEREKGEYFELLTKEFFKNDPTQSSQYEEIWTYAEWAEMKGEDKRDVGIDLVAKIKGENRYCAIQCKFYDEDYKLQKKDIDSFFTASGKADFGRRVIIDTTRTPWSDNAERALDGQSIDTHRLGFSELDASPIDWEQYGQTGKVVLADKKTLLPHQSTALEKVREGLTLDGRGKLIMACGTGKTFTSLRIAENIVGKGGRVLYLVPSLALMSQSVGDPAYPLKLFQRIITVSLETMKIVHALPKLEILESSE